jgi:hypothetical protein
LNDPVFVEAAQALARLMNNAGDTPADAIRDGFRRCLARQPSDQELGALTRLLEKTQERFAQSPDNAMQLATNPLGPAPVGTDIVTRGSCCCFFSGRDSAPTVSRGENF